MSKYETVIGLELHCALNTKSKVFSPTKNEYNEVPNINVNEIDLSFPGSMPSLNKEAVRKALKMSMVLGCIQPDELVFDRKNYYYPDLPKGYQITQITKPVGINGEVKLKSEDHEFTVKIQDIHLEEDTASLDHYDFYSLINYNRAGSPLVEIVTSPCIHSAKEAVTFLEFLANSFKYCDISEADTKKGQIRCDININLKDETGAYVTPRVEIKNVNSFAHVESAINYEIERQQKALESNEEMYQETRRYDELTNTTIRMRLKENAYDYKYFVEPNIPRIKIDKEYLDEIRKEIPTLPNERQRKYIEEYNISYKESKTIIKDILISNYFEECISLNIKPKVAFNWITSIIGYLNKENITLNEFYLTPNLLKEIIDPIEKGTISSKQGKDLFNMCLENKKEPSILIKENNMEQLSNDDELVKIIDTILENNPKQREDYHNGRTNLFDYFVGQIMKETKGKANPVKAKELLKEKI